MSGGTVSPGPGPQGYEAQGYGSQGRRGPAAWLVVLLTLLGVGVLVGTFAAGVGVGVWAAGQGTAVAAPVPVPGAPDAPAAPAPAAPAPGAPDPAATSGPGGPAGALDPCLVGTWRTTEHEESYDTEQGAATLTDLDRTMTFDADGTQRITYDASQALVTTDQGALPAVFQGEVVYRTSTSGSTMSFTLVSTEGTVTVLDPAGEVVEENPIEPGTADVGYTCDGTTFVQEAAGYRSAYERVG